MICVTLQGGLGNQLFQIFTAAALAVRTNRGLCATFHESPTPRECFLGRVFHCKAQTCGQIVRESREFSVQNFPDGNIHLVGYFQHKNYFDEWFEEAARLLDFQVPNVYLPGTAIHVRRTDFTKLQHIYVQLDKEYYTKALKHLPRPYTIVTDDPRDSFVVSLANEIAADEIRCTSTWEDFVFLASHTHLVCANSTFSWWAGYLAKRQGAHVTVPPVFLRNGSTISL